MTSQRKTVLDELLEANPELNIPVNDYNINVTANQGAIIDADQLFAAYRQFDGAGRDAHLYFHLPLCDYICHFCNYVKRKIRAGSKAEELMLWARLLIRETSIYLDQAPWIGAAPIRSFYIGGGTGALLLNNELALRELITHVETHFALSADCERSIEGNPENFTDATVALALDLGFNRFSVGVQSLQQEVNSFSNRGHSPEDALRAIEVLLGTGKPFSVDMMFGLPYQTPESFERDIHTLVAAGVPCITLYRLRNAERERMGIGNASVWNSEKHRQRLTDSGMFPSVSATYRMRDAATAILRGAGYHPSPCGWWNKAGTYPDGNIPRVSKDKWEKYNSMLAFGPGAYGWLTGGRPEFLQTHNITDINKYMAHMEGAPSAPPLAYGRVLEGNVAIGTRLSFAFKANQPLVLDEYRELFGVDLLHDEPYAHVFAELVRRDLMVRSSDGRTIMPTWKGEELHEEIMYVYFHKMIGGSLDAACKRRTIPLHAVAPPRAAELGAAAVR
jgi:oxygen-independent coproporphyrinogen-3 oxidase